MFIFSLLISISSPSHTIFVSLQFQIVLWQPFAYLIHSLYTKQKKSLNVLPARHEAFFLLCWACAVASRNEKGENQLSHENMKEIQLIACEREGRRLWGIGGSRGANQIIDFSSRFGRQIEENERSMNLCLDVEVGRRVGKTTGRKSYMWTIEGMFLIIGMSETGYWEFFTGMGNTNNNECPQFIFACLYQILNFTKEYT